MAEELELHFVVDGKPEDALATWREDPPGGLEDRGYEVVDESYNSLTYEARFYDWPAKVLFWTTFGVGYLFKDFMVSIYKLTVRFDSDERFGSRVTVLGKADDATRAALGRFATEHGGTGLRVGA